MPGNQKRLLSEKQPKEVDNQNRLFPQKQPLEVVGAIRAQLAMYDFLLPGDYVPDPPLVKRWFRWRPAFEVTQEHLVWAGTLARARSLMDLKSVAEAIATEARRAETTGSACEGAGGEAVSPETHQGEQHKMTDSSVEAVAPFEDLLVEAYKRGWTEACETIIEEQMGDPMLMPHMDAQNEGCGTFIGEAWPKLSAALAALPSPEREPMREALANARAYVALGSIYARKLGEMEVVREAGEMLAEIDALLAPPTAQSGDRT